MKKITFLLLALICAVASMAQTTVKVVSKTGPVTAPESGKLYAILCNSQQSFTTWMKDAGESSPYATRNLNLEEGEFVAIEHLWNITPGDGNAVYSIQNYATNRYISINGTSDGGTVTLTADEATVIISSEEGNEWIAFKHMTADQWIDMGYNGGTTGSETWSGNINGSRRMQIYEVDIENANTREIIMAQLKATYTEYNTNHAPGDISAGTEYGNYGVAEVAAYQEAMGYAVDVIDAEGGDLTDEELEAVSQKIIDAWNAVVKSKIPYAMEIKPGYYVIKNALAFTTKTTTEVTEDPDTGEEIGGETITKYWPKAIYEDNGKASWKTFEPKADFLFKVEATDKYHQYKVTNVLNGYTFNPIAQSANVTMAKTDSLVCFDWRWNDVTVVTDSMGLERKQVTTVNIRLASQAERAYVYAHAGGHQSGAGVSGNIVGWSTGEATDIGATDWYLEEIDAETAQAWIDEYEKSVKYIRANIDSVNTIIAAFPAQKTIAIDAAPAKVDESVQVASASTFTSPWTETGEGSIGGLFDEVSTTYWHSAWGNAAAGQAVNTTPGTNYFVIHDAGKELKGGLAIRITRRSNASNDHPTAFMVYGANAYDPAADKGYNEGGAVWTELGALSTPYGSNNETVTSNAIAYDGNYEFYKFVCTETNPIAYNRGYFHIAELRVYPSKVSYGAEITQAEARAAELKAVEDAIAAWEEKNFSEENVSDPNDPAFKSAFEAVANAYAAWTKVYSDPAPMRAACAKAEAYANTIVEGTNPGQWPAGTSASEISTAIAAAAAYNNKGAYTPAETEAQTEAVNAAIDAVAAKANAVQEGKWYTFRFATEEEYETWGWDKSGAVSQTYGDLYGLKVSPANVFDEEDMKVYEQVTGEDVRKGIQVRFVDSDPDEGQFRFVAAGDGKMAIQHVSGWYLAQNGTLSNHPALFTTRAIGCGKNLIKVQSLDGQDVNAGGTPSYLHAQVANHALVAWAADAIDSRSALYIEEVTAPKISDTQYEDIYPGTQTFFTTPTTISNVKGAQLYAFEGYEVEGTSVKVAFSKTATAEAGKAVLMVVEGTYPAEITDDTEKSTIEYTLGNTFAAIPDSAQALVGTYKYQWVAAADTAHTVTIYKNELQQAAGADNTDCSRDVSAYTGAIDLTKAKVISTAGKDLVITIEGEFDPTAVKEVIAKTLNTNGKIYSIDGKYVGTGNIGTVSQFGSGIYIVNGVKISVK